jgi:hypothetical protein
MAHFRLLVPQCLSAGRVLVRASYCETEANRNAIVHDLDAPPPGAQPFRNAGCSGDLSPTR